MVDDNTAQTNWPELLLLGSEMFSKWGFRDGEILYYWLEWAREAGCDVGPVVLPRMPDRVDLHRRSP
ncbi:hypothetical protein [Nocardia sp. NPDC002869]|uniref:hypothetical protein n=1 Tax=Nocardia sp. NPDC002869 TaxID=3161032 RepID=UPI00398CD23D